MLTIGAKRGLLANPAWTPKRNWPTGTEPGLWYDPSAFADLYQDSAGASLVTAVAQPIGLMMDKRLGLALGANVILNGEFATNTNNWNLIGAGGSLAAAAGELEVTGTGGNSPGARQTKATVVGATYLLTATARRGTANTAAALVAGAATVNTNNTTSTQLRLVYVATATTTNIECGMSGAATGTVYFDNVSFREIPGNHISQATTTARPVGSARVNLLVNTASTLSIGSTNWGGTNQAGALQADGSSLISRGSTSAASYASQSVASSAGVPIVLRIKVKKATIGNLYGVRLQGVYPDRADAVINLDTGVVTSAAINFTGVSATMIPADSDGFWTLQLSATPGSTALTQFIHGPAFTATGGWEMTSTTLLNAYAKEPQLEAGLVATRHQRVNTNTDYDTAGFQQYLSFDGIDDGMSTPTFAAYTLVANMDCFIAIKRSSTAKFICASDLATSSFFGAGDSAGGVNRPDNGTGAPTYWANGVLVPPERVAINTAVPEGQWVILEARNLNLSPWTSFGISSHNADWRLNGGIGGVILCPAGSEETRTKNRKWLGRKVGLSL